MFPKRWTAIIVIVVVLTAVIVTFSQYRKAAAFEDRLGCVATWLEEAKVTHELQMKDRINTTEDSIRKLMDQIERAYGCATRPPSYLHSESRDRPASGLYGMHPVQPH
jgi:HAMP domain-containing protein